MDDQRPRRQVNVWQCPVCEETHPNLEIDTVVLRLAEEETTLLWCSCGAIALREGDKNRWEILRDLQQRPGL
jgi:hypothetical protein